MATDSIGKTPRFFSREPMVVALVSFILYLLTLAWCIYPGESASLMAVYTGIDPVIAPAHPIWGLLVALVDKIAIFPLAIRLNLFSALIASFTLALFYHLIKTVICEVVSEPHTLKYVPVASRLAAITGVVVLATSQPFWVVATRLHYQAFDLFLLLSSFWALLTFARTKNNKFLILSAFIYGLGIVESIIFIPLLFLYIPLAVLTQWRVKERPIAQSLLLAGLPMLAGLLLYVASGLIFMATENIELRGYTGLFDILRVMLRDQASLLKASLQINGWIVIFAVSAMPCILALVALPRSYNNERSFTQLLVHLAFLILCLLAIFPTAISPYQTVIENTQGECYPVILYAMTALTSGYIAGYLYLIFKVKRSREGHTVTQATRSLCFWCGCILIVPFLLAILGTAIYNGTQTRGSRGKVVDQIANRILDRMGDRTWFVTTGGNFLDSHLTILSHERGKPVHVINMLYAQEGNEVYIRRLTSLIQETNLFPDKDIEREMLRSLEVTGLVTFLQDWLTTGEDAEKKMVIFNMPDFWFIGDERMPMPEYLFFGAVKNNTEALAKINWESYESFWNEVLPLLKIEGEPRHQENVIKQTLLRHQGLIANNVGFILATVEENEMAYRFFKKAREIDPENISALFNQYVLVSKGLHPEDRDRIRRELEQLERDIKLRKRRQYPLWSLSMNYGYIRSPEILARLSYNWAVSGQTGAALSGMGAAMNMMTDEQRKNARFLFASIYGTNVSKLEEQKDLFESIIADTEIGTPAHQRALIGLMRYYMQTGDIDKAQTYLDQATKHAKNRVDLALDWALLYLSQGDKDKARLSLQQFIDTHPRSLNALSLLAMMQLADDEIQELKQVTMPRMELLQTPARNYFLQIVRGEVFRKDAQKIRARAKSEAEFETNYKAAYEEELRKAREAYMRATVLNPGNPQIRETVLWLDIELADREGADTHARQVLRLDRNNALANYVLGAVRLSKDDHASAEEHLRISIANSEPPLYIALNDLAETLRRTGHNEEALKFARQATEQIPENYIGWETTASILLASDKLEEAEEAAQKAVELYPNDARLMITLGRIQVRLNRMEQARVSYRMAKQNERKLTTAFEQAELRQLGQDVGL